MRRNELPNDLGLESPVPVSVEAMTVIAADVAAKAPIANPVFTGTVTFDTLTPTTKPTVTGSRGGNAALASLLTGLAALGLITNSTTA